MKDDFAESTMTDEQADAQALPGKDTAEETPRPARVREFSLFWAKAAEMAKQAVRTIGRAFRKDSVPNMALVLTLTAVVVAGLAAVTYRLPADIIRQNREAEREAALSSVFFLQWTLSSQHPAISFEQVQDGVYVARDANGVITGYAVVAAAGDFGSQVELLVGVDMRERVTGVAVLSQQGVRGRGPNELVFVGDDPDTLEERLAPLTAFSTGAAAEAVAEAAEVAGAWVRGEIGETEWEGDAG